MLINMYGPYKMEYCVLQRKTFSVKMFSCASWFLMLLLVLVTQSVVDILQ